MDQSSILTALATPGVTLPLYRAAMEALDEAYVQVDSVLLSSAELCPAGVTAYCPRGPYIYRDLMALGVKQRTRQRDRSDAHDGSGLKSPGTEEAYLGIRYVVEGAQFGSRVIYRHLLAAFGPTIHDIGSFWAPESFPQGSWPGVLSGLSQVEARDSLAALARAARGAFRHMNTFLATRTTEAA